MESTTFQAFIGSISLANVVDEWTVGQHLSCPHDQTEARGIDSLVPLNYSVSVFIAVYRTSDDDRMIKSMWLSL